MEEGDHDPGNGVSLEVGNRFSSKVSRRNTVLETP